MRWFTSESWQLLPQMSNFIPLWNEYTFNKYVYSQLLNKTVTKLTITGCRAADQQLYNNLRYLSSYMVSCKAYIEKFHKLFDAH